MEAKMTKNGRKKAKNSGTQLEFRRLEGAEKTLKVRVETAEITAVEEPPELPPL